MVHHYSSSTSSSESSSSMSPRIRRPRRLLTEQDLRRNLEILGTIPRPLSPTLPPSPPASPRPTTSKRKRDSSLSRDSESFKLESHSEQPQKRPKSEHSHSSGAPGAPPTPPPQYKATLPPRIRKGPIPKHNVEERANMYTLRGKALKKSGEKRLHLSDPPDHDQAEFIKKQKLLGVTEVTHALINFAYAFWLDEYRIGQPAEVWRTIRGLLNWTRNEWEKHGRGPKERAFLGYLAMLENFTEFRLHRAKLFNNARCLESILRGSAQSSIPSPSPTPPTDNSPNHTQTPPASTPNTSGTARGASANLSPANASVSGPTISISRQSIEAIQGNIACAYHIKPFHHHARYLSIPILQTHFPRTFNRVTSLVPSIGADDYNLQLSEEIEIHDLEVEEQAGGDFPYPGAPNHFVWVLLLGRSMIGEALGDGVYSGLEGPGNG